MFEHNSRGASDVSEAPRGVWRRARFWVWPLGLACCVAGGSALLNWINDVGPTSETAVPPASPLQVERLRSFIARKNGQKQWEFQAARVLISPDGRTTTAQTVSRAVLYREGRSFLTLQAPFVRLANDSNNLEARGGVRAQGPNQFSFQTQIARWKHAQKQVEIPGQVRARLRKLDFRAQSLRYDWDKGVLRSEKPVEIRSRGAFLQAGKLSANIQKREIELGGGVRLVFDPRERDLTRDLQSSLKPFNSSATRSSQTPSN